MDRLLENVLKKSGVEDRVILREEKENHKLGVFHYETAHLFYVAKSKEALTFSPKMF